MKQKNQSNRILPNGFDKTTASEKIVVHGQALEDDDFVGGSNQVTYRVNVGGIEGPLSVNAELWYQPIGFRWAQNLMHYDSPETNRFVNYFDSMSEESAVRLLTTSEIVESR